MAAFELEWALTYEVGMSDKPFRDKIGVTSIPAGSKARVADVGAYSLGISRTSAHRAEAVQLVRFLIDKQAQSRATPHIDKTGRTYFEVPLVMTKIYPWWCKPGDSAGSGIVLRPSVVAGSNYEAVSKAYSHAFHSVLTGESTAPAAVASIEKQLVQIMGSENAQAGMGSR